MGRTMGRFWPIGLSRFANPKPHFGLVVGQNHDSAVSWAMWLKSQSGGHLPPVRLRSFCAFQASEGPKHTTGPKFWPPATPVAPSWAVMGLGPQRYGRVGALNIDRKTSFFVVAVAVPTRAK